VQSDAALAKVAHAEDPAVLTAVASLSVEEKRRGYSPG
jgi:hypothetical protein